MHQPSLNCNDVIFFLKFDPLKSFLCYLIAYLGIQFQIHGLKFSNVNQMFMDFWFSIIFHVILSKNKNYESLHNGVKT
jgi:hypothetical protein